MFSSATFERATRLTQASNAAAEAARQQARRPPTKVLISASQEKFAQNGIQAEMEQFDAPASQSRRTRYRPTRSLPLPSTSCCQTDLLSQKRAKAKRRKRPPHRLTNARNPTSRRRPTKRSRQQVAHASEFRGTVPPQKKPQQLAISKAMVAEAESDKPKTRPAWVDDRRSAGNTRREVIATGPYATVDECNQAADVYC